MNGVYTASENYSIEDTITLIRAGNERDRFGKTLLHCSARAGRADIVEALIAGGEDVNARDKSGRTPLHYSFDNAAVVKALIAAGADIRAKNRFGFNSLHRCAYRGYTNSAKALIAGGADLNVKDASGSTPLDLSIERERKETSEVLIKYTLLRTPTATKPKLNDELGEFWNICEEEIKKLQKTSLGNSRVTFFDFLRETDENRLAIYSSKARFGLRNHLKRASFKEKFSTYFEDIESQFIKGAERAYYLHKSQKLMKECIFKSLPIEIIIKICKILKNKELENLISPK